MVFNFRPNDDFGVDRVVVVVAQRRQEVHRDHAGHRWCVFHFKQHAARRNVADDGVAVAIQVTTNLHQLSFVEAIMDALVRAHVSAACSRDGPHRSAVVIQNRGQAWNRFAGFHKKMIAQPTMKSKCLRLSTCRIFITYCIRWLLIFDAGSEDGCAMSIIRPFRGHTPQLGDDVFVAENAAVIGDVVVGQASSIWYSATVRGDVMPIRIGTHTSIQDNAVIHVTAGRFGTEIGNRVTVGHGAIIHACVVEDDCLIGMGSVLLDGCRIGRGSLIGAGALVTPGTIIPPGSMVVGSPAKVKREISQQETQWIAFSSQHYVDLARAYIATVG